MDFIYKILIALLAGISIGIERQWRHKAAGLRTNTLVTVGAAIYVSLALIMTKDGGDVTRIIGQVVTGVGFLGAGIIFKDGLDVRGLTTAATIWCSAAVGCLVGAALYMPALISTITIVGINTMLKPIDKWLNRKQEKKDV